MPALNAPAVDEDADVVSIPRNPSNEIFQVGRARQVGMVDCGFPPEGLDLSFCAVVRAPGTLDEDDVCSCFGEGEGERLSDPAGGPGKESGAAL